MSTRREHVPFDPYYFEKKFREGRDLSSEETFRHIHETNHWRGAESISGEGASQDQTRVLREALPRLLETLDVNVLLDLPCGDLSWMRHVDLPVFTYLGADLLPDLIATNQQRYGNAQRRFLTCDLTRDDLPDADCLLCRDCLVHLSFTDAFNAVENIRNSSIPYLLTTTFPECEHNEDIITGDWRLLNLTLPPFNFPQPLTLINEGCTEADGRYRDKSLGLWRVDDLPSPNKQV